LSLLQTTLQADEILSLTSKTDIPTSNTGSRGILTEILPK